MRCLFLLRINDDYVQNITLKNTYKSVADLLYKTQIVTQKIESVTFCISICCKVNSEKVLSKLSKGR